MHVRTIGWTMQGIKSLNTQYYIYVFNFVLYIYELKKLNVTIDQYFLISAITFSFWIKFLKKLKKI